MVGKNKMKSWKMACAKWNTNEKPNQSKSNSHNTFEENQKRAEETAQAIWQKQGFNSEEEYNEYTINKQWESMGVRQCEN